MERSGIAKMHGNPLTLVGPDLKEGDKAPDFVVLDNDLNEVKLSDFEGKSVIISAVPSLDTPVCELQTIKFNQEASQLNAKVLTISMDLPFAQKRFCDSFKINNALTLSDFKDKNFANNFGLYIKELGLITRAVYVINDEGIITYREIVGEVSEQPDYDKALEAASKL